ncbi:hypothetical protein [Sulfurospirillum diekertiae]|uniref:Uncharacterized protein n=1 Tax=Sulfurospirillum diekertiae TaxID=1854492 RepID=A0A1Y0HM22_9BACT|nr:hypothetical protein [Sulfurospirillum diekertiae]ARU48424.1 hypothetical protein Sdiek1_1260 [Sulfurospirillum diekertiae]ASC93258.1 hypothetical protein Sdiek2_1239 [Sulfurospirillum diekertiae]
MATNTGKNHRIGSIKDRSQFYNERTNTYLERDAITGLILKGKQGKPFKGVAKEPDGRKK